MTSVTFPGLVVKGGKIMCIFSDMKTGRLLRGKMCLVENMIFLIRFERRKATLEARLGSSVSNPAPFFPLVRLVSKYANANLEQ